MNVRPSNDFNSFATDGSLCTRRQFTGEGELLVVGMFDGERRDARATHPARAEFGENLLRGLGLLRQRKLQVMTQRVFNRDDVIVRHPNPIRQRADDRA